MDESQQSSQGSSRRYRSRPDAVIWWLRQSRDNWKHKYGQLKQELKRAQNRARAAMRGRETWKRKAKGLRTEKERLSRELEQARQRLQALEAVSSEQMEASKKARRRAER